MTMQATNATELADEDIHVDADETPEAGAANDPKHPAGALDRGVLGGELPNVPIPPEPVDPDPVPLRHESPPIDLAKDAGARLDEARAIAARIASIDGESSDRLLAAADPLIDKLDAIMSRLDGTKVDIARAEAEAASRYQNLPHIDGDTMKKIVAAAKEKARSDLMETRGKELEKLANEAQALAAVLDKQIKFEKRFSDSELAQALDGQRTAAERESEDWLVSRLHSEAWDNLKKTYDLGPLEETYDLLLPAKDPGRVRRFERAALRMLESILEKSDHEVSAQNNAVRALRFKIQKAQAARRPDSIERGDELLNRLHDAWRHIAGIDNRRGAGVVTAAQKAAQRLDESKMDRARAEAKTWKPMEKWHERHFRKAK